MSAPRAAQAGAMGVRVALAALIILDDEDSAFAAPVPPRLFGQPIVELQCRLLRQIGTSHIVVLAERLPLDLMSAVDRLDRDGISVEIVRTAREAADHLHPEENVIVLSGPLVPQIAQLNALADAHRSTLIVVPPDRSDDVMMRIDAQTHWSGLAQLEGSEIRETVAMLGDWALTPTLLRRAVQSGVPLVDAADDDALAPVRDQEDAMRHAATLLSNQGGGDGGHSLLARALARLGVMAAPQILRAPRLIGILDRAPAVLAVAAVSISMANFPRTGLGLLMLAMILSALAAPFARLPIGAFAWLGRFHRCMGWAVATAGVAYGISLSQTRGDWTAAVLGLWLATLLRPFPPVSRWQSDAVTTLVWLLACGVAGWPLTGFAAAIAHLLGSRLWSERMARA